MNKVVKYIFMALVVVGAIVSYFSTNAIADVIAFAVACGSAGVLCASLFKSEEKRTWKEYLSVICVGVGAFGLCFGGVAPDTVSQIISAVVGVILLIVGCIAIKK